MFRSFKSIVIFSILALALALQAVHASVPELKRLFERTFISNYVAARCGDNIMRLVKDAEQAGINLANANVVEIVNDGFSVFGLLNVEMARESGRLNPDTTSAFRNLPGERNWYHHVVLEMDGHIFDYDFTNTATVLPTVAYAEQMFLKEKTTQEGGNFYVGRASKLKEYKTTFYDAVEALRAREARRKGPEGTKMSLGEFLQR